LRIVWEALYNKGMDVYRFLFPDAFTQKIFSDIFSVIWRAFAAYWWVILPPTLFYIFLEQWILYWRKLFLKNVVWEFLELKVPRDVLLTPKAMEQIFAGLQAISTTPDTWQKELRDKKIPFKAGKLPLWVSFELLGTHSGISFFVRTPKEFRPLVETQFRSQYPQIQILDAKDYTEKFQTLPSAYTNMWGTEYKLGEDPVYPVKTYQFFEERVEEQRLDPMAPLLELLSHLQEGEEIWVQMNLRGLTGPQTKAWKKAAQAVIDKLMGKKTAPEPKNENLIIEFLTGIAQTINDFLTSFGGIMEQASPAKKEEKKEEKTPQSLMQFMSPGQRDRVEQMEKKLAKPVFETMIRVLYHAPKTVFDNKARRAAMNAFFRSFNTSNLNEFKGKKKDYNFFAQVLWGDNLKRRDATALFTCYRNRIVEPAPQFRKWGEFKPLSTDDIMKRTLLNIEECATLYHFPISQVEASKLYRVQTKTQAPPSDLPIIQ